jgi:hypothetical protein
MMTSQEIGYWEVVDCGVKDGMDIPTIVKLLKHTATVIDDPLGKVAINKVVNQLKLDEGRPTMKLFVGGTQQ